MNNKQIIILMLLVLGFTPIFPTAHALLGYDEFTDDNNQTIIEVVENNLGNSCTDCNASFWLNYPNGTLRGFYLMRYNVSSSNYIKNIQPRLLLVNGNTTIYTIKLRVNRTPAGQIFNGTSDRTIITIYNTQPGNDSQWDVGIAVILISLGYIFLMLFIYLNEEHNAIKWIFAALALGMNMISFRFADRILSINGIATASFTRLLQITGSISLYMTYAFTIYVMIYILYYIINNAYQQAQGTKANEKARFRS